MAEIIPEEKKVQYNFLGRSGLKVSRICFGAMTFGQSQFLEVGQSDEFLAHQILDRFVAWGGNFIDTADIYGVGNSERIVGSWLQRQPRDNFVVATKCFLNMQPGNVNSGGSSRRHLTASIEGSLERLQTHYVDLYEPHCWDKVTPLEETFRTLDDLVRCGKIRYAGICNVSGWQLQKIVQTQEKLGLNPIVSLQQQYSLVSRESEVDAFQVCQNEGIGVLPWSPLKGGLLTGKVRRGQTPTEGRLAWVAQDEKRRELPAAPAVSSLPDTIFDVIDVAEEIGKKHDRSIAQVAIKWIQQKPVVSSTIIGATSLKQLDQNMDITDWTLSPDEVKELDEASDPGLPYPYNLIEMAYAGRVNKSPV